MRVLVTHASLEGDMCGLDPDELDVAAAAQLLDEARADGLIVGHTHA